MVTRTRRALGVVILLVGAGLIVASSCPTMAALLDFLGLINSWDVTCPTSFTLKALFLVAVIVLVLGQRVFSGRKLHTGEKPEDPQL